MKHFKKADTLGGFSLIEVIIVMSLSSIIMTSLSSSLLTIMKSNYSLSNYSDMNSNANRVRYSFAEDVGNASSITYLDTENFIINIPEKFGGKTYEVEYKYDSLEKTLIRKLSKSQSNLMYGVEDLKFTYYTTTGKQTNKNIDTRLVQLDATLKRRNGLQDNKYTVYSRHKMHNKRIGN